MLIASGFVLLRGTIDVQQPPITTPVEQLNASEFVRVRTVAMTLAQAVSFALHPGAYQEVGPRGSADGNYVSAKHEAPVWVAN